MQAIVFDDGFRENFDVLYAAIPFKQHSNIAESLGCELTESGHLKVDPFQKTNVPGIFACGDNSTAMRSVSNAVATGGIARAMVNNELTMEMF